MSGPDATATAALSSAVLHPCWVAWLDFAGDPVRVTTASYDVDFVGTGDPELDGFKFVASNPDMISISDVHHQEAGSDTVIATLSGLISVDADTLNIIGNQALWRGRVAALWLMLYDGNLQRVGNVWRYYTGTMSTVGIKGSTESQTIEVSIESYLASLTQASNRTYLDQQSFDPGDLSAAAAIAIANGGTGNSLVDSSGSIGMGSGGGGRFSNSRDRDEF